MEGERCRNIIDNYIMDATKMLKEVGKVFGYTMGLTGIGTSTMKAGRSRDLTASLLPLFILPCITVGATVIKVAGKVPYSKAIDYAAISTIAFGAIYVMLAKNRTPGGVVTESAPVPERYE